MKNQIVLLITLLLMISCAPKVIPLSGNYPDKPFELIVPKPIDSVWSNVIDLFATKGISIKIIDKTSGLITSEKASFINSYGYEGNINGKWVVLEETVLMGKTIYPQNLTGEWNIRIKSVTPTETKVNVNLTNLFGSGQYPNGAGNYQFIEFQGKSTGAFEKSIAELIK